MIDNPQYPHLPQKEIQRICEMHRSNGYSIKATAKMMNMSIYDFHLFILHHATLRTGIAHYKKLDGCYEPYGPRIFNPNPTEE